MKKIAKGVVLFLSLILVADGALAAELNFTRGPRLQKGGATIFT